MTVKDLKKLVTYWLQGAEDDWRVFLSLKRSRHYQQAAFFLHLSLEKRVKALVVKKTRSHAPYSHNLEYLLGKAGVNVSEQLIDKLKTISEFSSEGRYPFQRDKPRFKFNKEFITQWEKTAVEIATWLSNQF